MKLPRLSIAKGMFSVAVVAVNLAIARALYASSPFLFVSIALPALILEAGGFIVTQTRGPIRIFSTGFVASGFSSLSSVVWAFVFAPSLGIALDPNTGKMITLKIPGSLLWTFWSTYFESTGAFVAGQLHFVIDSLGFTAALIWALPQLLVAMAGGLLCRIACGPARPIPNSDSGRNDIDIGKRSPARVLTAKG